ncbi:MAG: type II secretion system protein [Clostridia bacterium]|nr:type II secretion system protein [Clostridia bacterium]
MFMHKSKKGFTIVELVIVIAVIAILAAVLIPTFSNLVKKANIASDTSLAKNINTALTSYDATNGVEEFSDVIAAAKEAGYIISNLNPTTEGCYFVWESSTNQILLVDSTDGYKVIYANNEKYATAGNTWYFAVRTQAEADAIKAAAGMADVNAKLAISKTSTLNTEINVAGEKTVYIDGGLEVDSENTIKLDNADAKITIDMGSSSVTGGSNDTSARAFPFYVTAGELNIKNGVVSATSAFIDADGETREAALYAEDGIANVEGTDFNITSGDSLLTYAGADGLIKDVTFNTPNCNNIINVNHGSQVTVENCIVEATYIAVHSTYGSTVTINGGTYHATVSNLLTVNNKGIIIVKDGIFNCDAKNKTFKFYNFSENEIVIEGGTFNGVAFDKLDKATLEGWCNLSDCAKGVDIYKRNGAWVIDVK